MKTEGIFEKISGLNMPGLILLAARPGMGKTSFVLNMARIVAEKKTAAVFSLEMSRKQVAARLLALAPPAENKRPILSDLRESGAFVAEADIVLFLYRDGYYNEDLKKHSIVEYIVAKNLHGETGTVELHWMPGDT